MKEGCVEIEKEDIGEGERLKNVGKILRRNNRLDISIKIELEWKCRREKGWKLGLWVVVEGEGIIIIVEKGDLREGGGWDKRRSIEDEELGKGESLIFKGEKSKGKIRILRDEIIGIERNEFSGRDKKRIKRIGIERKDELKRNNKLREGKNRIDSEVRMWRMEEEKGNKKVEIIGRGNDREF